MSCERLRAAGDLHAGRVNGTVNMSEDPILAETRAARERLVARFNGDLDALVKHLREIEQEFASQVVRRPPKTPPAATRKAS